MQVAQFLQTSNHNILVIHFTGEADVQIYHRNGEQGLGVDVVTVLQLSLVLDLQVDVLLTLNEFEHGLVQWILLSDIDHL